MWSWGRGTFRWIFGRGWIMTRVVRFTYSLLRTLWFAFGPNFTLQLINVQIEILYLKYIFTVWFNTEYPSLRHTRHFDTVSSPFQFKKSTISTQIRHFDTSLWHRSFRHFAISIGHIKSELYGFCFLLAWTTFSLIALFWKWGICVEVTDVSKWGVPFNEGPLSTPALAGLGIAYPGG